MTKIQNLPFQCQIYYTSLDGNKCVRVLSQQEGISHDREELEKDADVDLLGMNAVQQASKMARAGRLVEAQVHAKAFGNHMIKQSAKNTHQTSSVKNYFDNIQPMYQMAQQQNFQDVSVQQQPMTANFMAPPDLMMRSSDA